jgi:hypothetical protein
MDIEGRLEAFNLLNAANYDEYVGQLLSPTSHNRCRRSLRGGCR